MKKVRLFVLITAILVLGSTLMSAAGDKPITASLLPAPHAVDEPFCPACPPCPPECPVLK